MQISTRFKTLLVLLLTGAALYVGILNLTDRSQFLTPDDGLRWEASSEGLRLRDAGRIMGPEAGDLLIDINGLSIHDLDDYTEVTDVLAQANPQGTAADYTVRTSSGEERTHSVALELRNQLVFGDGPLIAVALLFLGSGLFVFLRSWQAQGAFHFYLLSLVGFLLLLFRHSGRADPFDIGIYWTSAVAFLLLPPLFLHFCSYFPRALPWVRRYPQLAIVLYLPATLLVALHAAWFGGSLAGYGMARNLTTQRALDRLELSHFLFVFALAAFALFWSRRRMASLVEQKQMQWVAYGTVLGLAPFALCYVVPYLLDAPIRPWMEASVLSLGVMPLSFGYAIARYRLMDVDVLVKKGAAYVLASSAVLAAYVGLALLLGKAVRDFSDQSGFLLLAATALAVAFLFAPLRNLIQEQIDRYFYRDSYSDRRSFQEFARTLGSEINLAPLTHRIADRIQRTLGVEPVGVFLADDSDRSRFHLYTVVGPAEAEQGCLKLEQAAIDALGSRRLDPFVVDPGLEDVRAQLRNWSMTRLYPLRIRGRLIGLLGLGDAQRPLTTAESRMVATLAGYAAIAIDNALLYSSLESKAGELSYLKVYNENVIESINMGVAVVSPDGEVTVWNSSMAALTGIEVSDALGVPLETLLPDTIVSSLRELMHEGWTLSSGAQLFKTHLASREGGSHLVNISAAPFVSPENVTTGTLLVVDDVTEKVRLESQLLQAEKLSSIGLFAAGIAHEVNTPLAAISSYSQLLLRQTAADDRRRESLEKIEKQSFRASEILNNLLNFTRLSESDFEQVDLNNVMSSTLSLVEHQLANSRVDLDVELDAELPVMVGNGGKLQQVFLNLLLNARDAMPEGGNLKVRTFREGSSVVATVSDTGSGISREDLKRIYDPFFTTKEVGKGTGLGLSICYGIVQEHSGRIEVSSLPEQGTTFVVRLPLNRVQ